jgi:hypothetical protein
MPPATLKVRLSTTPEPRSTLIAPPPVTDGMLKEKACGPPM